MVFLDGFLTGLILQVAIGPVFFFILNLALAGTLLDAYTAMGAAVVVDYFYITLAILGVGKALESRRIKNILGVVGAFVLCIFGWVMIKDPFTGRLGFEFVSGSINPFSSFISTFLLTISSPLTIVFWTGIFASRAVERDYSRKELIPFGIAAGLASLVFLGISITVIYSLKFSLPEGLIKHLNFAVGVILIFYGLLRLGRLIQEWIKDSQES
jgi:threonine/homoserine/homoserine lactone efflux protein